MSGPETLSKQVRECAERIADSGGVAVSGLYDLCAVRLVRFATTITRNQHDAEDAVQSALIHVVNQPRFLSSAVAAWPYLLRMVRNEALVILRKKKRWSLVQNLSDLLTRRVIDELEREDTYREIWRALRMLPAEQSEVVVLKIWEDLTFAQIAEILEIPLPTAASRYRYAIDKLGQALKKHHVEAHHE